MERKKLLSHNKLDFYVFLLVAQYCFECKHFIFRPEMNLLVHFIIKIHISIPPLRTLKSCGNASGGAQCRNKAQVIAFASAIRSLMRLASASCDPKHSNFAILQFCNGTNKSK